MNERPRPTFLQIVDCYGVEGALVVDQFGQHFNPAPRPKRVRKQKAKQCHRNAFFLAEGRPDLWYAEGLGLAGVTWSARAWTITAAGMVVDPTRDDGAAYFGIVLHLRWVAAIMLKCGEYGIWFALQHGVVTGGDFRRAVTEGAADWQTAASPSETPSPPPASPRRAHTPGPSRPS
jgi:hypothetical protein